MLFELVQGEGGIRTAPRAFFVTLMERCRRAGVAVWVDEVQTYARTGELFAFRWPWLPDERQVTTVRITFAPAGYGTLLELEDGPFRLDQPGGIDAWAEAIEVWSKALAGLRASVDFSVDLRDRT